LKENGSKVFEKKDNVHRTKTNKHINQSLFKYCLLCLAIEKNETYPVYYAQVLQ